MAGTDQAGSQIVIRIRSKPRTLKLLTVNKKGKWKAKVRMPAGFKCGHTLVVHNKTTGEVRRIHIVIGKPNKCR